MAQHGRRLDGATDNSEVRTIINSTAKVLHTLDRKFIRGQIMSIHMVYFYS
ncbi:unnamed protein product [Prunus brigantina]